MDKVIMPELIPPVLAEAIAENPEILKSIVDHQPNEEVIVGKNCTLDCGCNPTNVKLVFCNVAIGFDEEDGESGAGKSGERAGSRYVKIGSGDVKQKGLYWAGLLSAQYQLSLEVAVLEEKVNEIEKILRMIPRVVGNRKVVARCKMELNEATGQLAAKKKEQEYMCKVEPNEATEPSPAKKKEQEYKEELTDFWEK